MAPPTVTDFGKDAKDIFEKDFKAGQLCFETRSRTSNEIDVKLNSSHDIKSSSLNAFCEAKIPISYGLYTKFKLDSNFSLLHELEANEKYMKNFKQVIQTTLKNGEGLKSINIKNCFKAPIANLNVDFNFQDYCPTTNANLSIRIPDTPLFLGSALTIAPKKCMPKNYSASVCYRTRELETTATVNNNKDIAFSLLHRAVFADLACRMGYNMEKKSSNFELGFLHRLDASRHFRGKINQDLNVGGAFSIRVQQGVNFTVNTLLDAKNFASGNHKFGFAVDIVA